MHDSAARFAAASLFLLGLLASPLHADEGTRRVQSFDLPVSPYLSEPAQAAVRGSVTHPDPTAKMDNAAVLAGLASLRKGADEWARGEIIGLRQRYPVDLFEETWNGVPVVRVQPRNAPRDPARQRLLIELHGGAFVFGRADTLGLLEAIPLAAMTGATVVAVEYRKGPEHRFPAASEDVAAVYRAALERHSPAHIGVFGCSAGGVLTGESLAWFAKEGLPMPSAAGLFCAAGDARYGGDSRYVAAALNDALLPHADGSLPIMEDLYYGDVDFRDPLVSPVFSDAVLAQFPPTLFITATRAAELSAASYTHSRLIDLGRESDLHVWDGLGHAFHLDARLPESQQAYRVMARFFARHLDMTAPTP
ncbi:alpha/beta hydrolase [Stenotrophomonas sp. CFBP 13725]|uniref:alpha/beta hydrolase n=1 Tax=Stenotrophomonas sp. CFBP 13725 TaxID=2775297 RepID=UPI001784D66B|nr:alpha/beta hydrolase [Stenotrophomonas sp. CFBP 13725]MBD8634557.1 alpha/beta hydrolase fold domain-containing protein [Stenotrophomonas sp. CFBP 13725]